MDGLLHACPGLHVSWSTRGDPDELNSAVEGYLIQQALECGAVQRRCARPGRNLNKQLLWHQPWFTPACFRVHTAWHEACHIGETDHSHTRAMYSKYVTACNKACWAFVAGMPRLFKTDPKLFYDSIHPWCGPKSKAGCSMEDWEAHCQRVFDLPASPPTEFTLTPDPTHLTFHPKEIRAALCISNGAKASGPTCLPS